MPNPEPIGRRLWRVALIVLAGGCSFTVGILINNNSTRTAFLEGGIIMLAIIVGLIPVIFVMLRLERNNWQFSLRTLLITMTLLAVTLSAVAYALRQ